MDKTNLPPEVCGHVTESMWSSDTLLIPLADVQHIEKNYVCGQPCGLAVVTKHTRWDKDPDYWANSIFVPESDREDFVRAWCVYRHELEFNTLKDISPEGDDKVCETLDEVIHTLMSCYNSFQGDDGMETYLSESIGQLERVLTILNAKESDNGATHTT